MNRTAAAAALITACCMTALPLIAQVNSNAGDAAKRAQIAQARGQMTQAQNRLRQTEKRARATYKAQPELAKTEDALKAAQDDFEKAKKPVIARLSDDPAYKQEMQMRKDLEAKIQSEHAKAVADDPSSTRPGELPSQAKAEDGKTLAGDEASLHVPVPTTAGVTAAVDKAQQRSKLRELEEAAIAKDPAATAAKAKVDELEAQLKQMRLEYQAFLLNDADYKGALDQVNAAHSQLITAGGSDTGTSWDSNTGGVIFR